MHLVADTHALNNLDIFHAGKNLVLDLETGLHTECSAFFDGERLVLERLKSAWRLEVDNDVWSVLNLYRVGFSTSV